jgi:hypothetical protein
MVFSTEGSALQAGLRDAKDRRAGACAAHFLSRAEARIRARQGARRAKVKPRTKDADVPERGGIAWLQSDKNRSLPSNVPGAARPDRFYSRVKISSDPGMGEA